MQKHPENPHKGHRERLRQQFLTSPDSLSDVQLLELLLFYTMPRSDTNPLARRLLDTFGSLTQVLCAPAASLRQVKGVSERAAVLLSSVHAAARRVMHADTGLVNILNCTEDMAAYLLPKFLGERDEVVYLLCLDAKCKLLDCRLIARGSVNTTGVSLRKVLEAALACNATSVTLAHNHTSGIALPSKEDVETTVSIWQALRLVGIVLNDHIIVADNDYISLAQDGLFRRLEQEEKPNE